MGPHCIKVLIIFRLFVAYSGSLRICHVQGIWRAQLQCGAVKDFFLLSGKIAGLCVPNYFQNCNLPYCETVNVFPWPPPPSNVFILCGCSLNVLHFPFPNDHEQNTIPLMQYECDQNQELGAPSLISEVRIFPLFFQNLQHRHSL